MNRQEKEQRYEALIQKALDCFDLEAFVEERLGEEEAEEFHALRDELLGPDLEEALELQEAGTPFVTPWCCDICGTVHRLSTSVPETRTVECRRCKTPYKLVASRSCRHVAVRPAN